MICPRSYELSILNLQVRLQSSNWSQLWTSINVYCFLLDFRHEYFPEFVSPCITLFYSHYSVISLVKHHFNLVNVPCFQLSRMPRKFWNICIYSPILETSDIPFHSVSPRSISPFILIPIVGISLKDVALFYQDKSS